MHWEHITAEHAQQFDTLIINVRPGLEWVPGPYGAFIIKGISLVDKDGDELKFVLLDASGVDKEEFAEVFDVSEIILIKNDRFERREKEREKENGRQS